MKYIFILGWLCVFPLVAYEHQLSIVTIFRDEGPYLKEWIEYHKLVGVEHFYLFNNLSHDNFQEVLEPYIEEGVVELFHLPQKSENIYRWGHIQQRAYNTGLAKAKGKTKWLAIIDADEFIIPLEKDTIVQALEPFEGACAVAINWALYGTSNVPEIVPGKLMIEMLKFKALPEFFENQFVKVIVRPEKVLKAKGPHQVYLKEGYIVDMEHQPVLGNMTDKVLYKHLRINHYWSRDEKYFREVKLPRSKTSGGNWAKSMKKQLEDLSLIHDDIMDRFIPTLRTTMGLD